MAYINGQYILFSANVKVIEGGITPVGTLPIKNNGTHNVANYEFVEVNVAGGGTDGGSSECDGCIIEVDTLPTENIDETALYKMGDAYYKYAKELKDIIAVYDDGEPTSIVAMYSAMGLTFELYTVKTRPTENIKSSWDAGYYCYYVENENDILIYGDFGGTGTNEWVSFATLSGASNSEFITDISQATTPETMYALLGVWKAYAVVEGQRIIEVDELPTENIDESVVYKIKGSYADMGLPNLPIVEGRNYYALLNLDGYRLDVLDTPYSYETKGKKQNYSKYGLSDDLSSWVHIEDSTDDTLTEMELGMVCLGVVYTNFDVYNADNMFIRKGGTVENRYYTYANGAWTRVYYINKTFKAIS